ncbi:uncharacterized protein LOC144476785 [Augochlora pura]
MWTKLTALLLLLAVVSSATIDNSERRCVDGKSYYDGCNHCSCARGYTMCTLRGCFFRDPETGEMVPKESVPPPEDYWVA